MPNFEGLGRECGGPTDGSSMVVYGGLFVPFSGSLPPDGLLSRISFLPSFGLFNWFGLLRDGVLGEFPPCENPRFVCGNWNSLEG